MALSELRRRKQMNLFNVYDANRDGLIEQADLVGFARRLADIRGWPAGSPEDDELQAIFMEYWDFLSGFADADGDGRLTRDEWLVMHQEFPEDKVEAWASMLFSILDADGGGTISIDEYRQLFEAAGLDESFAERVFPAFDDDGDGSVSREDFIKHAVEFDREDGDAPGNLLFGPV